MRIGIIMNQVFDGWSPLDKRLGGTEEAIVRTAEELVKAGHEVNVYRVIDLTYNGVHYHTALHDGDDVVINVKSPEIAPTVPTLYWTNETDAGKYDLSQYKGVIWPSQWALEHIKVNNKNLYVVPHGLPTATHNNPPKIPKQCLYASSPDRGLDVLLEAWPKVHEVHPDATLLITYGGVADLPGVMPLGEVDADLMDDLYATSDIWAFPCTGVELFCITGKKAQINGCIPVIIPAMALQETVARGFKTDKEHYAQTLIEVLDMPMEARNSIRNVVREQANAITWKESADLLLKVINDVLH